MRLAYITLSLSLVACVADPEVFDDVDDAIDEADVDDKADTAQAYRHYVLWADPAGQLRPGDRHVARAGGGRLRCPDDVVRDTCELAVEDIHMTAGLKLDPSVLHDELEDHAVIVRGRLVRMTGGGVYLRASSVTRGITNIQPSLTCYRFRPNGPFYDLELLDRATVEVKPVIFFDFVDPTPEFWGEPSPAVQAKIDDALALAPTRPVYTCGDMDRRDTGDLYWATQVFAPAR